MTNHLEIKFTYIVAFLLLSIFVWAQESDTSRSVLQHYFDDNLQHKEILLPKKLREISGLALSAQGTLFAHNDESGTVYELDPQNGQIIRQIELKGKHTDRDYEGIAVAGKHIYLVDNAGTLFKFKPGEDKVKYKTYKTGLSSRNNVEGLCYDPQKNQLLLVCKNYPGKGYKGMRAVYGFDLETKTLQNQPRFLFRIADIVEYDDAGFWQCMLHLMGGTDDLTFEPSGIEYDPRSGHFFIIASNGHLILEMDAEGRLIEKLKLDPKQHPQPEGITFTSGHQLVISDEGGNAEGKITIYEYRKN